MKSYRCLLKIYICITLNMIYIYIYILYVVEMDSTVLIRLTWGAHDDFRAKGGLGDSIFSGD